MSVSLHFPANCYYLTGKMKALANCWITGRVQEIQDPYADQDNSSSLAHTHKHTHKLTHTHQQG
jgi:hypothetical protein